jgi:hypothetical protein
MPRRTREEAQLDDRLKREAEEADLGAFIRAYRRATGLQLTDPERPEIGTQDFVCQRSNGLTVGVELTQTCRPPEKAFWERTFHHMYEMDIGDGVCELGRLLMQKSDKVPLYSTKDNLLLLINCECDFDGLIYMAEGMPMSDFKNSGFQEIWLGDYSGIRSGAHRTINLFGLYPPKFRRLIERPDWDAKPYG